MTSIKHSYSDFLILTIFVYSIGIIFYLYGSIPPVVSEEIDLAFIAIAANLLFQKLRLGTYSLAELGLIFDRTLMNNILLVILSIVLFTAFIFLLNTIFDAGLFNNIFTLSDSFSNIELLNFFYKSVVSIFLLVIIEEFIFRGIAFQIIYQHIGAFTAILVSAIIFTLAHYFNPNLSFTGFLNIFLAGVLMGLMYHKSLTLYSMIVFHFVWNFNLAFVISTPLSGHYLHLNGALPKTDSTWLEILLGGSFGLEEGLITTLFLIILSVLVLTRFEESPRISAVQFHRKYSN
ncbi:MAG: type II CAAX endopeptidase family protein [Candidatus Kapaibacterium sp.]